ncbi:hypothetical protein ABPG74_007655 [Tetrahymena malaccensis]
MGLTVNSSEGQKLEVPPKSYSSCYYSGSESTFEGKNRRQIFVSSIEKKKAKILCLRIIFDIIRIGVKTFRNTQIGKGIPSCNDYEPNRKRGVSRCLMILSQKNWSWLPLCEEFLHSFCVSPPNTSLRGRNYLKNLQSGLVKDTGEYPQSANLLLWPHYFQERQNQTGIGNRCVQMRFYQNYTSPIIIIMKPLNILKINRNFSNLLGKTKTGNQEEKGLVKENNSNFSCEMRLMKRAQVFIMGTNFNTRKDGIAFPVEPKSLQINRTNQQRLVLQFQTCHQRPANNFLKTVGYFKNRFQSFQSPIQLELKLTQDRHTIRINLQKSTKDILGREGQGEATDKLLERQCEQSLVISEVVSQCWKYLQLGLVFSSFLKARNSFQIAPPGPTGFLLVGEEWHKYNSQRKNQKPKDRIQLLHSPPRQSRSHQEEKSIKRRLRI